MNKETIINKLIQELIDENLIICSYIKNNEILPKDNNLQNIEIFVVASNVNNYLEFQKQILESKFNLMYIELFDEKIMAVTASGYKITINYFSLANARRDEDITILYDPKNIVFNLPVIDYSLTNEEVGNLIDQYCFLCYDFYQYAISKDISLMLDVANELKQIYIYIKRYSIDKKNPKLGYDGIMQLFDITQKREYLNAIRLLRSETVVDCVQLLTNEVNEIIKSMPIDVICNFNYDFLMFATKKIFSL